MLKIYDKAIEDNLNYLETLSSEDIEERSKTEYNINQLKINKERFITHGFNM
jgi:hypothetical protein